MAWDVEYTDEFGAWWDALDDEEQTSVAAMVELLEIKGARLAFPYSSGVQGSRHSHIPRRAAILLIGGDKTGNDRWYDEHVPRADRLYDEHLEALRKEGIRDG